MIDPTTPFWRPDQPFTPQERKLLLAVVDAHHKSATRGNISGQVVQAAAVGSGDYFKSIAAGLLTLGGDHGPLEETHRLLDRTNAGDQAEVVLAHGYKLPGWGNSFHRGVPDPLWQEVDAVLFSYWPGIGERIDAVTKVLHDAGKKVYPNPSAYTAAAAIALGMPANLTPYLFVQGRLAAWSELFANSAK